MSHIIEKRYRSLFKAVTWRMVGTLDTIILSYFITSSFRSAFSIGFLELFTKMVLYFIHERAWAKLKIGMHVQKGPEFDI